MSDWVYMLLAIPMFPIALMSGILLGKLTVRICEKVL